jgi:hypothetical protein
MSQAPQPPPTGPPPGDQPPTGTPGGPPADPGGSRNPWLYLGVGAGIVVLAVVLFVALRPDDDSENAANTTPTVQTTTEATTEVTTTTQTTTEEVTTTTPPADQPQRVVVVVENGQPVGGVKQVEIEQGKEVVLVVRADVEDEVHLHGYDLSADVAPGQPARISFRADLAGEFEAELEDRAVPIVELVVSP